MGQLNIKDEELIAEAKALAAELGTSVTGALREAIQAMRTHRAEEREARKRAMVSAIMALAAQTSKHVPSGATSDHSDLYDEHGAPI